VADRGTATTAKASSGLYDFQSKIRRQYTPETDRFEVEFWIPPFGYQVGPPTPGSAQKARTLTVMCEEASIPGLAATNLPVKIGAWTEFRTQNVEFLTQETVFTFIADEQMEIRSTFEEWINACANLNSKEVAWHGDVTGTVEVKVINKREGVEAGWKLIEAMPKLISVTPLAWGNNQHIRISVSMVAKKWERMYYAGGGETIRSKGLLERILGL
jgi:hypothetical protein